jgi:hypothetical protein
VDATTGKRANREKRATHQLVVSWSGRKEVIPMDAALKQVLANATREISYDGREEEQSRSPDDVRYNGKKSLRSDPPGSCTFKSPIKLNDRVTIRQACWTVSKVQDAGNSTLRSQSPPSTGAEQRKPQHNLLTPADLLTELFACDPVTASRRHAPEEFTVTLTPSVTNRRGGGYDPYGGAQHARYTPVYLVRGRTTGYVPDATSASEQSTPLSLRPTLLDDIEAARTKHYSTGHDDEGEEKVGEPEPKRLKTGSSQSQCRYQRTQRTRYHHPEQVLLVGYAFDGSHRGVATSRVSLSESFLEFLESCGVPFAATAARWDEVAAMVDGKRQATSCLCRFAMWEVMSARDLVYGANAPLFVKMSAALHVGRMARFVDDFRKPGTTVQEWIETPDPKSRWYDEQEGVEVFGGGEVDLRFWVCTV